MRSAERLRMKLRRGLEPGRVQRTIRALKARMGWARLGELLGVSPHTVRGWMQAEPAREETRARVMARVEALGA